jgi:hypothetical protein
MKPAEFIRTVMDPGAAFLERYTGTRSNHEARRILLAIALQESQLVHRFQQLGVGAPPGPARSFWQFEQTGIHARPAKGKEWGILVHTVSRPRLLVACEALSVEGTGSAIWRAIEGNDLLAYSCARLLLLTDPGAIPTTEAGAWDCYANRLWNPGKPHPSKWPANWAAAGAALAA